MNILATICSLGTKVSIICNLRIKVYNVYNLRDKKIIFKGLKCLTIGNIREQKRTKKISRTDVKTKTNLSLIIFVYIYLFNVKVFFFFFSVKGSIRYLQNI